MTRGILKFLAICCACSAPLWRLAAQSGQTAGADSPEAWYFAALRLDKEGKVDDAIAYYRRAIKKYPVHPAAPAAQFRLAELLNTPGSLAKSFDAYQTLITRYPGSPNFQRALAEQIKIANIFLEGRDKNFSPVSNLQTLADYQKLAEQIGALLINSAEKAADMYKKIVANAPYSKYAPIAQFNLGLAYEKQKKAMLAMEAFQAVLDKYPTSDVCDDALYQIGHVWLRVAFGGGSKDLSALVAAKNTFEDFLIEFPNSEKAPQARDNLKLIAQRESGDIMSIAKFYERYKDLKAAAIYYNDVIRRQPNTKEAELAKVRIEELRAEYGDDALRTGPEKAETGEKLAVRRRLQAQVETSALADYAGPPKRDVVPDELPAAKPRLRTNIDDVRPLPPVEPALPIE